MYNKKVSYLIFFMNILRVAIPPNLEFAEVDKFIQVMLQWSIKIATVISSGIKFKLPVNVGQTSILSSPRWANVSPTFIPA